MAEKKEVKEVKEVKPKLFYFSKYGVVAESEEEAAKLAKKKII